MTRDLHWGVPVPLDDPDAKGKSLYVWFDAPIGYVSFTAALCAKREETPDSGGRRQRKLVGYCPDGDTDGPATPEPGDVR